MTKVLSLDAYQIRATSTAVFPQKHAMAYLPLKLCSEAGEVADKVGKFLRGDTEQFDDQALAKELGDVLWYVAVLADELGYDLSEIAEMNLEKLRARKEAGTLKGSGDNR